MVFTCNQSTVQYNKPHLFFIYFCVLSSNDAAFLFCLRAIWSYRQRCGNLVHHTLCVLQCTGRNERDVGAVFSQYFFIFFWLWLWQVHFVADSKVFFVWMLSLLVPMHNAVKRLVGSAIKHINNHGTIFDKHFDNVSEPLLARGVPTLHVDIVTNVGNHIHPQRGQCRHWLVCRTADQRCLPHTRIANDCTLNGGH